MSAELEIMDRWQTTRFVLDLSSPKIMGIVNLTPDSFSDGGCHDQVGAGLAHAERLLTEGADILDIGGESTRPGAPPVPEDEELARVVPVLREAAKWGVPLSIDTFKPGVMRAALDLGVDIVNDVAALRQKGALELVAAHPRCGVCLMHMLGTPQTMQAQATYVDVVTEVGDFLAERATAVLAAGVTRDRIVLDPGVGFAKSSEHNIALLARQRELLSLGYPLLVGWSRKRTLGELTGRVVGERMVASVAAAMAAVTHGARIVRVHDVAATRDALKVWSVAGLGGGPSPEVLHNSRPQL